MVANIKEIFNKKEPFLNLKIKCNINKINIKIIGKSAGNILMLSMMLPFNNSIKALCIPQPGHSIPRYFL